MNSTEAYVDTVAPLGLHAERLSRNPRASAQGYWTFAPLGLFFGLVPVFQSMYVRMGSVHIIERMTQQHIDHHGQMESGYRTPHE